jgi:spore germination protein
MMHKYLKKIFLIIVIATAITAVLAFKNGKKITVVNQNLDKVEEVIEKKIEKSGNTPEISGWIAWWIEDDGFAMAEKYQKNLKGVSPGWLKLDKNKKLVETGKVDKKAMAEKIKSYSLKLYPMMTTDLADRELSDFVKDPQALDIFTLNVIGKLKEYGADGLDLDFENIGASYENEFSTLIKTLSAGLKKNNLGFSATVQAQTGVNDWNGAKGQDLKLVGQYADEVRLMVYDQHGAFSEPGPITPMDWYKKVLDYNLKLIPQEKLVIGLPTYGYVWGKNGGFKSFQFKDFISYAQDKKFQVTRDIESSELNYVSPDATGWLSDSGAVISKIEYARRIGLNRFVLWNLSGTDEAVFEKEWPDL